MFEYIKRVSLAITFIARKIDSKEIRLISILEQVSLELLEIAQNFRLDNYNSGDLIKLQNKILYVVDVLDFARINKFISTMNATVFVDSMNAFLKHIINLLEQKNNLHLSIFKLKEFDDRFSRRLGREIASENFYTDSDLENHSYSEMPIFNHNPNFNYKEIKTDTKVETKPETKTESKVENKIPEKKFVAPTQAAKKIVEEKFLNEKDNPESKEPLKGTVEELEQEIGERRKRILAALINGGGSIREIAYKVPGVNEKTIQRDLLELMRDKKVIMLGKKRWAKYYLK